MIFGVVCFNVKYVNFGTQNLRSSNVKVIFQRPSCDVPYSGGLLASGFIAGTAQCPCGCIYNMEDILRGLVKEARFKIRRLAQRVRHLKKVMTVLTAHTRLVN